MRMVGGNGATSLVRRELDRLVRHLVDDVERLERPALPRGLLLDDAYFLLSVHGFGLGWRAARAVVRPARLEAYANADVRVARQEADRARPVGVPSAYASRNVNSDRYAIQTRNLQDWNLTRYRCANRSKTPNEDAAAVHRDLGVARDRHVFHDAAALALVLDARRGALDADRAAT